MPRQHACSISTVWTGNLISTVWTGNLGPGTSDPAFRGDRTRYPPEELLVASLSACHMLWMLHLCASAGIVVTRSEDDATGVMVEASDGGGEFAEVTLHPRMVSSPTRPVSMTPSACTGKPTASVPSPARYASPFTTPRPLRPRKLFALT